MRARKKIMSRSDLFVSRYEEDFEHEECIGKGGYGVVFKCRHKLLDTVFAVKRITVPKGEDINSVLKEAKAHMKLSHPNIVRFFYVWDETPPKEWQNKRDQDLIKPFSSGVDSTSSYLSAGHATQLLPKAGTLQPCERIVDINKTYIYIQMEFCEGGSLADRLLKNAIEDADMAKSIFKQILNGIDYIHKQNMIHRDIKPQNIFFSAQDKIKIGDFGLVTDIGTDISCKGEELKKRSACGTRLYLSPEQVNKKPYNNTVDIYASGLVLFELLMQFRTQAERYAMFEEIKHNRFPAEFVVKFPNKHRVLKAMLARNPKERITAEKAIHMLYESWPCQVPNPKNHLSFTRNTFSTKFSTYLTIIGIREKQFCGRYIYLNMDNGVLFHIEEPGTKKRLKFPKLEGMKTKIEFQVQLRLGHIIEYIPARSPCFGLKRQKSTLHNCPIARRIPECDRLNETVWYICINVSARCESRWHDPLHVSTNWFFKCVHINVKQETILPNSTPNKFWIQLVKEVPASVKNSKNVFRIKVDLPYHLTLDENPLGSPTGVKITSLFCTHGYSLITLPCSRNV